MALTGVASVGDLHDISGGHAGWVSTGLLVSRGCWLFLGKKEGQVIAFEIPLAVKTYTLTHDLATLLEMPSEKGTVPLASFC